MKTLNCNSVDEVINKDIQSEYLIHVSGNIGKPILSRLTIIHAKDKLFKNYISRLKIKLDMVEKYYHLEHQYKSIEYFERILPCICIGSEYPYTYKELVRFLEEG